MEFCEIFIFQKCVAHRNIYFPWLEKNFNHIKIPQYVVYKLELFLTCCVIIGRASSYGINDDPSVDEPHHIQAWFTSPFTGTKILFMPYPSHEVLVKKASKTYCFLQYIPN